jgi:predicted transcriptional regulator
MLGGAWLEGRRWCRVREFGQLESAVMDVVWAQDRPCAVREVRDQLSYGRPLAYTTVMTVMTILYGKGVLRREKHGRAWRYWPAERREEHAARLMTEVLRSGGDHGATLRSFLDRMSDDDLLAIRNVVARRQAASRAALLHAGWGDR